MKYCVKCGNELNDDAKFCQKCGYKQYKDDEGLLSDDLKGIASTDSGNVSPKSRAIAAVLAWFLGGFGGHRFYVGKTRSAILMAVFFWTLVPAIIALIDFIIILCGNFTDGDGKEIKKW